MPKNQTSDLPICSETRGLQNNPSTDDHNKIIPLMKLLEQDLYFESVVQLKLELIKTFEDINKLVAKGSQGMIPDENKDNIAALAPENDPLIKTKIKETLTRDFIK